MQMSVESRQSRTMKVERPVSTVADGDTMKMDGPRRRLRSVSLSSDSELSRANDAAVVIDDFPYLSSTMMSKSCGPTDPAVVAITHHHHHHHLHQQGHLADMNRAMSSNCIDMDSLKQDKVTKCGLMKNWPGRPRFNELPDECRLRVFSYLSILERAVAAQV